MPPAPPCLYISDEIEDATVTIDETLKISEIEATI